MTASKLNLIHILLPEAMRDVDAPKLGISTNDTNADLQWLVNWTA